jgi:hypothetical protein
MHQIDGAPKFKLVINFERKAHRIHLSNNASDLLDTSSPIARYDIIVQFL